MCEAWVGGWVRARAGMRWGLKLLDTRETSTDDCVRFTQIEADERENPEEGDIDENPASKIPGLEGSAVELVQVR